MRFRLSEETIRKILSVFHKHAGISKVISYGSRAKGTFRNGSDIDISLIASKLHLSDILKIESEIEELLFSYKFDLSLLRQIENENLLEHIQRVGVEFKI